MRWPLILMIFLSTSVGAFVTVPACDARLDKTCAPRIDAPINASAGDDWWLQRLKPLLSRDNYELLASVWPEGGVPPALPLPKRPQPTIAFNASLDGNVWFVDLNLTANERLGPPASGNHSIACQDPRGCPDLTVDATQLAVGLTTVETLAADDCNVLEGSAQAGTRKLLRFTTTVPNIGDGDLAIGNPAHHPDWFDWGTCHKHWHFRDYADYRLWDLDAYLNWVQARRADPDATGAEILAQNASLASGYRAGHKQGFCVIDVRPFAPVEPPKYGSCGFKQGVSRGWADEYQFNLDGQFIDITGLPQGPYVLEVEANPRRFYQEMDYTNNAGALLVLIT